MASPSSSSISSSQAAAAVAVATTPGSGSPCAACKFLRRKCLPGCVFAPYFPPEEPQKFANVHKVFGASNVTKLLNELPPHQREDAVSSLAYEAEARVKDPVYGCVAAISVLQRQVHRLQKELDAAHAELLRYACADIPTALPVTVTAATAAPPRLPATLPGPHHLAGIPPAGCYYVRHTSISNAAAAAAADISPVLPPYASMATWAVNAMSATTTSGSDSIEMDHKEGGDSSM